MPEIDNAIFTFGLSSPDKNKLRLGLNAAQDEFENAMEGGKHTREQLLQLVRHYALPVLARIQYSLPPRFCVCCQY
jgi:hypothetical protein